MKSIRDVFNRGQQQQQQQSELEQEAKDFRVPSEWMPQLFKYLFFIGLGFLNVRLFSHAVPGGWGKATGIVAIMAEAIALYSTHNFSRSAGMFRWALGICGGALMAFSLAHGTFSILDLIGAADVSAIVQYYSRVVAFPILAGLLGASVVAITMTHPRNLLRLKQALAHTNIVVGRAEAASELEIMRARAVLDQARLEQQRERNHREQEYLIEAERVIQIEQKKAQMVAAISDPTLREKMARELGLDPQALPQPKQEPRKVYWQGNRALDQDGNDITDNLRGSTRSH